MHVNQLQLDELYAVLRGVINGEISEDRYVSYYNILESIPQHSW